MARKISHSICYPVGGLLMSNLCKYFKIDSHELINAPLGILHFADLSLGLGLWSASPDKGGKSASSTQLLQTFCFPRLLLAELVPVTKVFPCS